MLCRLLSFCRRIHVASSYFLRRQKLCRPWVETTIKIKYQFLDNQKTQQISTACDERSKNIFLNREIMKVSIYFFLKQAMILTFYYHIHMGFSTSKEQALVYSPNSHNLSIRHKPLPSPSQTPIQHQQFIQIAVQTKQSRALRTIPLLAYRPSPSSIRLAPTSKIITKSWEGLFVDKAILVEIVSFLSSQDLLILKHCNKSLNKLATMRILENKNNWELTMHLLSAKIHREKGIKESIIEEELEHSEDLDRTSGYFSAESEADLMESMLKLDRVVTAVSFRVKYFQGVMPICAMLLQCFDQNTSYWVLKYLLFKCNYIQNDMEIYQRFLKALQVEFQEELPELYKYLDEKGFELNYFVMKWIMGLFSQDLPKKLLLSFWDILCQTDLQFIMYFIISIFKHLQSQIWQSDEDQINTLLKSELKQKLENIDFQKLIGHSKTTYLSKKFKE